MGRKEKTKTQNKRQSTIIASIMAIFKENPSKLLNYKQLSRTLGSQNKTKKNRCAGSSKSCWRKDN